MWVTISARLSMRRRATVSSRSAVACASFRGKELSKRLDDEIVAKIVKRREVRSALPRMDLVFPASGKGWFEGQEIKFEVGGFCDGWSIARMTSGTIRC